jgi:hypothetical protein
MLGSDLVFARNSETMALLIGISQNLFDNFRSLDYDARYRVKLTDINQIVVRD